jgi:hypothetical protein
MRCTCLSECLALPEAWGSYGPCRTDVMLDRGSCRTDQRKQQSFISLQAEDRVPRLLTMKLPKTTSRRRIQPSRQVRDRLKWPRLPLDSPLLVKYPVTDGFYRLCGRNPKTGIPVFPSGRRRAHNIACKVGVRQLRMPPGRPGTNTLGRGDGRGQAPGIRCRQGVRAAVCHGMRQTRVRRTALNRLLAAASRERCCSRSGGKRAHIWGTKRPCCFAPSASAPVHHCTWCARSARQCRSSGRSTAG